jgi:hypothetical protein
MTKLERTIAILKRGWTTSLECAQRGGVLSLSQRVGDLRALHMVPIDRAPWWGPRFDISEKWVVTKGGARVKAWRITRDRGAK